MHHFHKTGCAHSPTVHSSLKEGMLIWNPATGAISQTSLISAVPIDVIEFPHWNARMFRTNFNAMLIILADN